MSEWWSKLFGKVFGGTPAPNKEPELASSKPTPSATPPTQQRRRRVTVGLDFGTSSTKCCFKEEAEGKPLYFVAHDPGIYRGSSLLFPSTAAVDSGCLYFGFEAESKANAKPLRSFKMCLLCQAHASAGKGEQDGCGRCLSDHPGMFDLGGHRISAEDLATLYLAVILGEALSRIPKVLSIDSGQLRVQVNSAAPLDQMSEFGSVGEYFERAVFYAFRLAERSRQGWSVNEAMRALEEVRRESKPAVEQSPTRVFPETHAAITGYLLLPQSEKGLYGLVDIGAGTTDVAFFWLQKHTQTTKACYYSAGSIKVGMDDVDLSLQPVLGAATGDLRRLREAMDPKQLMNNAALVEPVVRQIHQHYARTLFQAMRVDQRDWAWSSEGVAKFGLFLVGGGARCGPISQRFAKAPTVGSRWERAPQQLPVPRESRVSMPDGSVTTIKDMKELGASPLLLLAYGLSHPRPDIPAFERDSEGVQKPIAPECGPTVEERFGHF